LSDSDLNCSDEGKNSVKDIAGEIGDIGIDGSNGEGDPRVDLSKDQNDSEY
jgi:hypothetical protein